MSALAQRNFRIYFVGQAVSSLGSAMVPVAIAFAVLRQTHSADDLGIVLTSFAASQLAFMLAGGVIADRVSRRAAMLVADGGRLVADSVLAGLLITGRPPVLVICLLVVVEGAGSALFMPASTGLVPSLVPDDVLQSANSLLQISGSLSQVIGPAIAGVIVVTTKPGWALAGDGASYLVSVITLALLQMAAIERPPRRRFFVEMREGWTEFVSRRWYWQLVLGALVFNGVMAIYNVLGPVASIRFYSGAATWATIATALGVGSVLGGFVGLRLKPRHPLRVGLPIVTLFALPPVAIALRLPVVAVAAFAVAAGASLVIFSVLFETTVQRHIPAELLSRVIAYDWFGSLVAYPVGLAVAAPLAGVVGLRPVLLLAGLVMIAVVVVQTAFVPEIRNLTDRPEPAAEVVPAG